MNRQIKFRAWDKNPRYEIGDDGSVWSTNYKNQGIRRMLTPSKATKRKDPYITFVIQQKRIIESVKHLVAFAFVPNPENKKEVVHINGNKEDNSSQNLKWVTRSECCEISFKSGRSITEVEKIRLSECYSGEKNPKAKLNKKIVEEIRTLRSKGEMLKSISKTYSISTAQVSSIANNKTWTK